MNQHNRRCFVCGRENPYGLSVQFECTDGKVLGVFQPNSYFQGYPDILHGGIISTMLDGAMNRILLYHHKPARTGKLYVRFKKQSNTNDSLYIMGEIITMRKRFALTRAEVHNQKNELVALAEATFILQE